MRNWAAIGRFVGDVVETCSSTINFKIDPNGCVICSTMTFWHESEDYEAKRSIVTTFEAIEDAAIPLGALVGRKLLDGSPDSREQRD